MAYNRGKILGIDASRCVVRNGTGVEMYSKWIISALLLELHREAHPRFESVRLYSPREISESVLGGRYAFVEQRIIQLPRLWTHVRLSLEMLHEEPDVLFIPSHVLPLHHAKNSVTTIHDVAFMEFPEAYPIWQRMYLKFSTWLAAREASAIIVPSQAVADNVMRYFLCERKKIHVIPHGFEKMDLRPNSIDEREILESFGITQDAKYIFYVGRLEEKKNIARLVRAFMKFHEKHPDWKLILGGSRGYGFENIFVEIEKLRGWDCVLMPGYLSNVERDVLYRHCQFVAFVSLVEGFGFPVLEAASFGKAVLASNIPVLHEVGGEFLTYVNPFEVSDILRGMNKLADRSHDDKKHAENMRSICHRFSWESAGQATLRLLESVIQ